VLQQPVYPIGMMTSGRVRCLDTTLRSLSATDLPADQPLMIFDDSPATPAMTETKRYLALDEPLATEELSWHPTLDKAGLFFVKTKQKPEIAGVGSKVAAFAMSQLPRPAGENQAGVVAAGHFALRKLFEWWPEAEGVFLVQDDVIFVRDWYGRMLEMVAQIETSGVQPPLGLLSGLRVNRTLEKDGVTDAQADAAVSGKSPPLAVKLAGSGTATCLFMTRDCFIALEPWLAAPTDRRKQFDDYLAGEVRNRGFSVWLHVPYVCQHFGVDSVVRKGLPWTARGPEGRIGWHVRPDADWALADEVRWFPGAPFCPPNHNVGSMEHAG